MDPTPQQLLFTHLHRLKTLEIDEKMIQQMILELHIKIENRNQLFEAKSQPTDRERMEHSCEITLLQCEIEVLRCKERRAKARYEMENVEQKNTLVASQDRGQHLKKLAQSLSTLPPQS